MNAWIYIGMIVIGILMVQSTANFTFGHLGMILILIGGGCWVYDEMEAKKKEEAAAENEC